MNKKGFTFIELMIAITLFLFLFTIVIRLSSKSNENSRSAGSTIKKTYIAKMELEKYKSILENEVLPFSLDNNTLIEGYYVKATLNSLPNTNNIYTKQIILKEISIEVSSSPIPNSKDNVILKTHILVNKGD